ncbi:hypothetical protein HRbin08_00030 [bacterium HR08]|nr:hypothetical protein HRbin08_00030 [bacterium HR08]
MKSVSLVMLGILCMPVCTLAQTSPLHLRVVGDVEANKALKIL